MASFIRSACWNGCATTRALFEAPTTGLYERVDKLLRELANPNLHDIANMCFRVESWDQQALHIRWVIAASGSVFVARAAFDEAVKQYPDERLTLLHGILLMQERPIPPGKR
jgi:hypothetical protein